MAESGQHHGATLLVRRAQATDVRKPSDAYAYRPTIRGKADVEMGIARVYVCVNDGRGLLSRGRLVRYREP